MVIILEAAFEAEFVQSCVVTLEPVEDTVSDRFMLVYGPVTKRSSGRSDRRQTRPRSSR